MIMQMGKKGVRNHEKGFSNGKGQTMKRRVEALSCYNKTCEECHGAADSWYVHSIVKLSVKVQAKQVKGAISFFQPGLLSALSSAAKSFIATHFQPYQLIAIRHTLLPLLGLAMVF